LSGEERECRRGIFGTTPPRRSLVTRPGKYPAALPANQTSLERTFNKSDLSREILLAEMVKVR
jgi:hypothetical protein